MNIEVPHPALAFQVIADQWNDQQLTDYIEQAGNILTNHGNDFTFEQIDNFQDAIKYCKKVKKRLAQKITNPTRL